MGGEVGWGKRRVRNARNGTREVEPRWAEVVEGGEGRSVAVS